MTDASLHTPAPAQILDRTAPDRALGGGPVPAFKRPLDVTLTTMLLVLGLPLMLCIAALVKLSSPGPILFRQTRIGLDDVPFQMLKFRSMYADAESRLEALQGQSDRDGVCFKIASDPRVTPLGRILRRLSLDELPQLLNVLKGDMSLVGPRPGLPSEVAQYTPRARQRLNALPGITGAWQVGGRADVSFDQMVEMDIDYIAQCSLRRDLHILLRTFRAVLDGKGAY